MASAFNIMGKTTVSVAFNGSGGSYSELGYTDNNDLINFELDYMSQPIMTTAFGDIPENYIYTGTMAYLNMTLIKWDRAVADDLIYGTTGAGAEGEIGTIGGLRLDIDSNDADSTLDGVAVKLVCADTTLGTTRTYIFNKCLILGRGLRVLDFGNRPQRLAINFTCLPELGDTSAITATDHIYSVADA